MLKLLKGSFIRLFGSSEFQLIPFILIIANTVMIMMKKSALGETGKLPGLSEFNASFHVLYIGICVAMFVALFIGTEYSNATIFNKIIFGHSRTTVYFTYLLTCLFAAAFFHLSAVVVTTVIGWIALGKPLFTIGTLAYHFLLALPPLFATVSLHLNIAIILQNRAVSIGTSASLSTVMLFCSMFFGSEKNYPNELFDLLPDFYLNKLTVSETLVEEGIIEKLNFPVYPCLLFIVFTVTGLIIFNNINIKNTPEGEV